MAIQQEGKPVEEAEKGMELAVSINGAVVGRNLFEKDELYSFIPPKSFSALLGLGDALSNLEMALALEIQAIEEKAQIEKEGVQE